MTARWMFALAAAAALGAAGCAKREGGSAAGGPPAPSVVFHDHDEIRRYRALGDSGYALVEAGKTEGAVALFTLQAAMIPNGRGGAYNAACAYARAGDVERGLEWLGKAVDAGWENTDLLAGDTDLNGLRTDARFDSLSRRAAATRVAHEAAFANGLPQYDRSPVTFPDEKALAAWADSVQKRWMDNRSVWQPSETIVAGLDIEARRLAAMRDLHAGKGDFDYGLERVRSLMGLRSDREPWGPLAKGVVKEAEAYLAGSPPADGKNAANYYAGVAAYCEANADDPKAPGWSEAAAVSRAHFAKVEAGTPAAGAAAAWLLRIDLAEAAGNDAPFFPKIRSFADTYAADPEAMDVAASFFQRQMVEARWPIPIETVDIDNKPVSLGQYKGKVVLVDFWATWCGPCRGELPYLRDAHAKYASQGFEILSISLDFPEKTSVADFRAWVAQNGMTWRHVYDQKGWKSDLAAAYLVHAIPSPVLVGKNGRIVAMGDECRGEALAKAIEKALAEPA